ncbi:hypothetical protein NXY28_00260 [Bacteroides thetaiotaomicron]|nr:hypothetical protein NXY28_00260 [Bacteroides thetaiotaomicron]
MIKVEKEVSNDYIIKGFKHFTQLATEYFQDIRTAMQPEKECATQ